MRAMSKKRERSFFMRDVGLIVLSILVSILLMQTHALTYILTSTIELEFLGSFIAGMFFTSVFTTAPAIVTLSEIAQINGIFTTALWGAAGAVAGDLLIFKFIRDRFSRDVSEFIQHQGIWRRFRALFKYRSFRWLTLFAGGLIIASPLPDELGIALLGFSRLRTPFFIALSFTFNFLGIIAIGTIVQTIAS